ncbi:MAG TPA: GAF domain-containing SpoIIE family protein phosphatase [Planctomycetaceae bacterium]|nr:GAF domain-containing SpoIIE family protein phosphatase [Planctomycetaceae bacterium]
MPMTQDDPPIAEHRLAGLMKLVEITCELAAQHDLDQILKTVTTGVCSALECERASLFLHDAARGELYTRTVTELEIKEIRFPDDTGIGGWVIRRGLVANIPDPYSDARWNSKFDKQTGFRTRNILAAPVVSPRDGHKVGVLQLLNKINGGFDQTDERILQAFAAHAATALERAQLLEDAKRHQQLQVSIEMGRSIQASFLPQSLPDVPGYELAAWWQPAEAVSGDYYDILHLPDGRLGIVVADVSGHGIGPSLIMASLRAMLRVVTRTGSSEPQEILRGLSQTIYADLQDSRFITFLMVALDPRTHRLTFTNAGHGPALHYCCGTGEFRELEATGLPIGVLEDGDIEASPPFELRPGDKLLLATDGAIELTDAHGEMFGIARLKQLVLDHCQRPAHELLHVLRQAIVDFHPHVHPPDDVTLLLVGRQR